MSETEENIEEKKEFVFDRKQIPTNPGVYLYYDVKDNLLYVGKAKNLRKRVSSYFRKTKKSPKTILLVSKIMRIETRLVNSESEALILENNLIKKHRPRFNILLRDDKTYMYLRITAEPIPKMMITRRLVRDGSFYAGPKTNARSFRKLMDFCQKLFQIRTCKLKMELNEANKIIVTKNPENRKIPCLDYHIGKCNAPCDGTTSPLAYNQNIQAIKQFLRGDTKDVEALLKKRMGDYVAEKKFEAAAKMRDMLLSIEVSTERQRVEFTDFIDRDFIGLYRVENRAYVVRFVYRKGKLVDQTEHALRAPDVETDEVVLCQFLIQMYPHVDTLPSEIYLPLTCELDGVVEYLMQAHDAQRNLTIKTPQKGEKLRVIEMVNKNASHFGKKSEVEHMSKSDTFTKALPELAEALNLPTPPSRIEGFDISHLQGTNTVASMVVFTDGMPDKGQYRRFKIKTLPDGKIDDYASMNEVLARRFAKSKDKKFSKKFPDLFVIDGGKGQLSAVMKAVTQFKDFPKGFDPDQQIISLAKREEEIFRPGEKVGILLDHSSPALRLLQRVRDESHRFAVGHNRALRIKDQTKSLIDEVPGIGAKTKKKLLQTFGSVSGIRNASDEDVSKVVNKKQLESLRQFL